MRARWRRSAAGPCRSFLPCTDPAGPFGGMAQVAWARVRPRDGGCDRNFTAQSSLNIHASAHLDLGGTFIVPSGSWLDMKLWSIIGAGLLAFHGACSSQSSAPAAGGVSGGTDATGGGGS